MTVGMLFFVLQDVLMKALVGDVAVWTLITARGVLAILALAPLLVYLGRPHRLLTPLWPLHLLRSALFAIGFTLFFAAFPFMNLAAISTIFFSAPLMTALMATLFLGEKIGLHRISALVIGFVGVLIAMNPAGDAFSWISALPLVTAITYAGAQVVARRIGDRETSLTLGLYTLGPVIVLMPLLAYAATSAIEIGPEFRHLRWDWSVPADLVWLVLVVASIGLVGYILISRAYQIADASLIAPFDYTYLPFAAILGYAVWDETPAWNTLAGMALIIGSGLYIGYRELRQARRVVEPAPTAEIAFAPSAPIGAIALASDAQSSEAAEETSV